MKMPTRKCNKDFEDLLVFLSEYKIKGSLDDNTGLYSLKSLHKHYYALLTLYHELKVSNTGLNSDAFWLRIGEVVSELGSSYFLLAHGCHKASKLLLRSSIENFAKAFGSQLDLSILEDKSVYKVFERSYAHPVFSENKLTEVAVDSLNNTYSALCKAVHTAGALDMQKIEAIGSFPQFDRIKFDEVVNIYNKISNIFVFILCCSFKSKFLKIHYDNQDVVRDILRNEQKAVIFTSSKK
jgi:hypothetical protein